MAFAHLASFLASVLTAKKDKNWRNQQQDFSDLGKNFAECFNFDQISVVT